MEAAVTLEDVAIVESSTSSIPTVIRSARRRDAIVNRADIYRAQMAERASKNDVMWSSTVRDLGGLYALKLLYEKQRTLENAMFYLAIVSIVAEAASSYLHGRLPWTTIAVETTKGIVTVATAALLVLLFRRYTLAARIKVASSSLPSASKFYHTPLVWDFCIELSLLLVHIPPGLGQYTLQTLVYIYANSFSVTREAAAPLCPKYPMYVAYNCYAPTTISISQFGIVLVPRIYLVGRYIRNVFGFNTNEVKLIGSLQNVDAASAWFVRKFLFRFYPAAFSAFILIALWTLTAWAVDQAERSIANGDLAEYVDVLWLVVVTISTVGYGDCAVVGFPGRVFIVVGGVVGGAAICSMCRVVVVGALAISPNEQCVIDTIKEREEVQQMRSLAVHLIQAEWRRYKLMSCSPAGQLRHDVTKALHTARVLKYRVMALARSMRRTHQRRHQGLDAILTKWKGKVEQENDMDTTRSSFGTLDRTVRRHDLVVIATCDKAVDKLTAVLAKLRQPHVQ
ncbi:hypothetical protein, variant 1 [Aphanomyces invadans]|uniref:Potassium channel domain-containing protein n=1 Tax=Aphanomyces invadans TaxID=157072 RepID=A0A024UUL4_9STRA|nr:hypothetical protein, variant 1 [Aphanomyces invadans]ETW09338.1 hypothetical protein, variant 1 [Aphanomyces invadans]|eukprot:XP_008863144.1 hypothetical protein, variant 1 [Aphanomyces invadans]